MQLRYLSLNSAIFSENCYGEYPTFHCNSLVPLHPLSTLTSFQTLVCRQLPDRLVHPFEQSLEVGVSADQTRLDRKFYLMAEGAYARCVSPLNVIYLRFLPLWRGLHGKPEPYKPYDYFLIL